MHGYAADGQATHTTSGLGYVNIYAHKKDGTGSTTVDANENLLVVHNGGITGAKFIVDAEGDIFYDGAANSYDTYDDAHLIRALEKTLSPKEIIQTEWDEFVQYNETDLIEAGILGDSIAKGGLVNGSALDRLHNGTLVQHESELYEHQLLIEQLIEANATLQARIEVLESSR